MARAAKGHRAAVFKAIRSGGTHTKAQLSNQLEYLTTKSSHIVDSRGVLDGKKQLTADEIKSVTDRFANRWDAGFRPKMGHTTHMLMSFPIGTRGEDVRDIASGVCERFFANDERNFDYLIAVHEDRAHPHAHVVLNRRSQEGEYFYLGRDHHFNYDDFRVAMVEEAEKVGVRLEATRRIDRGIVTYAPRAKEIYAAKEEGRTPVARERIGRDLDRALAEIANTSTIYRSLAAEASAENREDISNALFRAGELLAQGGQLEQNGEIYVATQENFDDLRGRFAERAERVEAFVRDAPDTMRAKYEKQLNAIYQGVSHMQPLGVRSATLTEKPSDTGVYSEANINKELVAKMKEPETRAQIETALRGTGIASSAVIARIENGAGNAALERQWIADDLDKIAKAEGLNLERKEDLEVAAAKLDQVHVQLGSTLERAEVLRQDGVVETEREISFHYDEIYVDTEARAARQALRGEGLTEAQIADRAAQIEDGIYDRVEREQNDYLEVHPEILSSPRDVVEFDDGGQGRIVNQDRADQIDKEIEGFMERTDGRLSLSAAVAADFKARYPDMPDHLANGLGDSYAASYEVNNADAIRQAEREAAGTEGARARVSEENRLDAGTRMAEAQGITREEARLAPATDNAEIRRVIEHERVDKINTPFAEEGSRETYRAEIERELSDEQLESLKQGDSNALNEVIDDRLDRLYAAKAYLQSDEATANSDAAREVVSEIAEEEYDAQRLKHVHGNTEKGQTHG